MALGVRLEMTPSHPGDSLPHCLRGCPERRPARRREGNLSHCSEDYLDRSFPGELPVESPSLLRLQQGGLPPRSCADSSASQSDPLPAGNVGRYPPGDLRDYEALCPLHPEEGNQGFDESRVWCRNQSRPLRARGLGGEVRSRKRNAARENAPRQSRSAASLDYQR